MQCWLWYFIIYELRNYLTVQKCNCVPKNCLNFYFPLTRSLWCTLPPRLSPRPPSFPSFYMYFNECVRINFSKNLYNGLIQRADIQREYLNENVCLHTNSYHLVRKLSLMSVYFYSLHESYELYKITYIKRITLTREYIIKRIYCRKASCISGRIKILRDIYFLNLYNILHPRYDDIYDNIYLFVCQYTHISN